MVVPLQVLAAGSILVGFLGVPVVIAHLVHLPGLTNLIERFMEPAFVSAHHSLAQVFTLPEPEHGLEWGLMGLSVLIAAAGIVAAVRFYRGRFEIPTRLAAAFPRLYRLLLEKYRVDELYGALFVRGLALGGGRALHANDRYVIDGGDGEVRAGLGVNGIAWGVRDGIARASDLWDRFVVDGAVNLTAFVLDNTSYALRAVQNGLVQHYALSMLIGLFLLIFAGRFVLGLY
jgi:NADH-quinone oxidoreductase subunit L